MNHKGFLLQPKSSPTDSPPKRSLNLS